MYQWVRPLVGILAKVPPTGRKGGNTLRCGTQTAGDGPTVASHAPFVNRADSLAISASSSSRLISVALRPLPESIDPSSKNSIKVRPALAFAAAEAPRSLSTPLKASRTSSFSDAIATGSLTFSLPGLVELDDPAAVIPADVGAFAGDLPALSIGASDGGGADPSIAVSLLKPVDDRCCFPGCITASSLTHVALPFWPDTGQSSPL
jgi:hypothetical protein